MFYELCLSFVLNLLQYTVVDRWAGGSFNLKTERSLRCHLAKANWGIKCNYNYSKIKILLYSSLLEQ